MNKILRQEAADRRQDTAIVSQWKTILSLTDAVRRTEQERIYEELRVNIQSGVENSVLSEQGLLHSECS